MARFKIVRLIQKISNLMLALIVLNERNIKYEVPKNDKESTGFIIADISTFIKILYSKCTLLIFIVILIVNTIFLIINCIVK